MYATPIVNQTFGIEYIRRGDKKYAIISGTITLGSFCKIGIIWVFMTPSERTAINSKQLTQILSDLATLNVIGHL